MLILRRTLGGVGVGVVLMVLPAIAVADNVAFPSSGNVSQPAAGTPANCVTGACLFNNPLGSTTLCGFVKNLVQAAITIFIPVAVLFIIWSGFQFVFAQGRPKELQKARRNFYWTIIGLAIFLGAWILVTVIAATINAIGGATLISCQ